MNKKTLVNLVYQQTVTLAVSVQECFASPIAVKERVIKRLGLTSNLTSASIPAELEPYIEEYWQLAYHFICDERRLLDKMIVNLYSEDNTHDQRETASVLAYLDSRIDLFHETANLMGYEITK